MASDLLLLPKPQILNNQEGRADLRNGKAILLDVPDPGYLLFTAQQVQKALTDFAGLEWFIVAGRALPDELIGLRIGLNQAIAKPQGYQMQISAAGIRIEGHDEAGVFYAVQTFIQLLQQHGNELPSLEIVDWPDLPDRGVLLDISRDKVPKMETLYELIDLFASWKINQFQLYTEHTFAYRNHPDVWAKASPITAEEILLLDAYCRQRFIDLVPNQNCFGHMNRWFEHPRYLPLAETPDGYTQPDGFNCTVPYSLNPTDPDSIKFVSGLLGELLPNFSSKLFNANCDETFELGLGKSKESCEERGKGRVYLDFLIEIYQQVQEHGRTMQFWGDIVGNYPELVPDLPSNVIALEWGYEANHPFAEKCRLFAEANIPFYVCPGTSSWNSIGGRTDNALGNIRNAIENGIKQGALGVLNTDWGDGGHLQQLPVGYLGWAYGAGLGWAFEKNEGMDVPAVLDAFAFYDKSQIMGRLVYDLGNVYQSPDFFVENSSILFWAYSLPLDMMSRTEVNAQIKNKFRKKKADFSFKLHSIINTIDRVMAPLDEARMDRADAGLINQELRLTAAMLKHGARRLLAILGEETPDQAGLDSEFSALIETYETLWLKRNRPGGLTDSLDRLAGKQPVYPGESWEQFLPGIAD